MKIKELYQKLEERIPRSLSCPWDNDGLMCCPDAEKDVRRVLIALDVTAEVAEQAVAGGYDLVVSHHPLIFRPLKSVNPMAPVAKKVIRLLTSGITVMSFHTRLDAVKGGVNDCLAAALGLSEPVPFGNEGEEIGRIGELPEEMTLADFAERVKQVTGAPYVTVGDAGVAVRRVAVLGGSGSDDVAAAEAVKEPLAYGVGTVHVGNRVAGKDNAIHVFKHHDRASFRSLLVENDGEILLSRQLVGDEYSNLANG